MESSMTRCQSIRLSRALCVIAAMLLSPVAAKALDIVRESKPVAAVVLPDEPTDLETEAARTFVSYVAQATGAALSIVPESQAPAGPLVAIGHTRIAAAAGITPDSLHADAYILAVRGNRLIAIGRDQPIMPAPPGQGDRIGAQGSRRAVYAILEHLGFRWLLPLPQGTYVPQSTALAVPDDLNVTHDPQFLYVAGRMYTYGDWSIANGFRKAVRVFATGGHTWDVAVPADLWDSHPEYFRMQAGVRINPHADHQLCPSNPQVLQRIIDYTLAQFREGYDLVALGQPDGWKPCECAECGKLGAGDAVSDQVHVTNLKVIQAAYQQFPDRFIHMIIYGPTQTPPKSFTSFPPNVAVELAPPTPENLAYWKPIAPGGATVYVYYMGTYQNTGIGAKFTPAGAQREMAVLRDAGVRGIYFCGGGENWGAEGPTYYALGRYANGDQRPWNLILDEYCRLVYGPAAATMRQFYELLYLRIDTFMTDFWRGGPATCIDQYTAAYSPDAIDRMDTLLTLARSQAKDDPRAKGFIRLAEVAFQHSAHIARVGHLYRAYQLAPSRESLQQVGLGVAEYRRYLDALTRLPQTDPQFIANYFPSASRWTDPVDYGEGTIANNYKALAVASPFTWNFESLLKSGILPGQNRARAVVTRIDAAPVIDGKLESAWQSVPWLDVPEASLGTAQASARFRIACDDRNLYFFFEAAEPRIDEMKVTEYGRDGKVFNTECFEVFLAPDGTGQKRIQFCFSPTSGGIWDGRWGFIDDPLNPLAASGTADTTWNANLRHAYQIDRPGKTWSIEVAVPFADLGVEPPVPGDRWRANVGRERHLWVWDKRYANQSEYYLWSTNFQGTGFPDPAAFGDLYFQQMP
jgi:hypothetical protein